MSFFCFFYFWYCCYQLWFFFGFFSVVVTNYGIFLFFLQYPLLMRMRDVNSAADETISCWSRVNRSGTHVVSGAMYRQLRAYGWSVCKRAGFPINNIISLVSGAMYRQLSAHGWSVCKRACRKMCFRFGGTKFLNARNTKPIWGNQEIPWRWEWRSPHNGFVERILTHQHCVHRLKRQAWVVNPDKEGNNPRLGWGKKTRKVQKGGEGVKWLWQDL